MDRDAGVVQAGHLRLYGAGVVLAGVVALAVRGLEQVALVRVALGPGAEVAGDLVLAVDAQELVEGVVVVVVQGAEVVGRRGRQAVVSHKYQVSECLGVFAGGA